MSLNTQKFPHLLDLDHFKQMLGDKPEIRFMDQPNGTTVCSYIISGPDTFDNDYAIECRGLVFAPDGALIARPLHKFFNVNQMEATLVQNIDWSKVVRVMDKRDGSMIHTVDLPSELGNFTLKSKKSYTSDVAIQATKFVQAHENYIRLCEHCVNYKKTPIFEWTSPTARIVLAYGENMMTLLHLRDNYTGEYSSKEEIDFLGATFGVPVVEDCADILDLILADPLHAVQKLYDETEGVEGWVFQMADGEMVKLKTKWYMDRHHAMTFLRVRDIANMVIDETIDDLIAKLVGDGINVDQIRDIERKVVDEVAKIESDLDSFYASVKHLDRKTLALEHRDYKYFSMLMQKYSGREPDVKAYFSRHHLDQMFDLTQLNLVDSIAEEE